MRRILALSLLLTLLPQICGCMGTEHTLQSPGQTGVGLGSEKVDAMFPGKDGKLVRGKTRLTPGTLIRVPATTDEVIQTLKDAGVKIEE